MDNKTHFLALCFAALAMCVATALSSCINDDFTTSPSDVLAFSTDSVKFDTVITAQGTPTKQFVVYNRSKKQVSISSIKVESNDGTGAHFYLNVDGTKGSEFHDIEVRGQDSIYVFVESLVDVNGQDKPVEVKDRIEFVTNGVTQTVVVTAWGQDVIILDNETLEADTELGGAKPYLIYGDLTVAPQATLTLQPGTTLLFHDEAGLEVEGRLLAQGTRDNPVVMRGDRLDHVVGRFSFDILSGQWDGVNFTATSTGNEMRYVNMRGSTTGVTVAGDNPAVRSLHLFNCVLHNSATSVLTSVNAWVDAEGCEMSDAASSIVNLMGGTAHLTQCTLANFYLFAAIDGPILFLVINDEEGQLTPLTATIDNCVLYGNCDDINMGDLTGTNVLLRNCLLKSAGTDDDNFIACRWKGDPKFYTEREKYIFDYRLRNTSDAIAGGNRALCPESARYDLYGQDRWVRDGIDIGAYAWVPAAE